MYMILHDSSAQSGLLVITGVKKEELTFQISSDMQTHALRSEILHTRLSSHSPTDICKHI